MEFHHPEMTRVLQHLEIYLMSSVVDAELRARHAAPRHVAATKITCLAPYIVYACLVKIVTISIGSIRPKTIKEDDKDSSDEEFV